MFTFQCTYLHTMACLVDSKRTTFASHYYRKSFCQLNLHSNLMLATRKFTQFLYIFQIVTLNKSTDENELYARNSIARVNTKHTFDFKLKCQIRMK